VQTKPKQVTTERFLSHASKHLFHEFLPILLVSILRHIGMTALCVSTVAIDL